EKSTDTNNPPNNPPPIHLSPSRRRKLELWSRGPPVGERDGESEGEPGLSSGDGCDSRSPRRSLAAAVVALVPRLDGGSLASQEGRSRQIRARTNGSGLG